MYALINENDTITLIHIKIVGLKNNLCYNQNHRSKRGVKQHESCQ